jgi:hypothetical protein
VLFPKLRVLKSPRRDAPRVMGVAVTMRELRAHVLIRDDYCVLRSIGIPGHACGGRFDSTPYHERDFTLEHVTGVHGVFDGRVDDDEHCVALDFRTNIDHTTKAERERIRKYLRTRFPTCSALSSNRGGSG